MATLGTDSVDVVLPTGVSSSDVAVTTGPDGSSDVVLSNPVSTMIYVEHNAAGNGCWRIYTDRGFEASISAALGFDVCFTEQGMQDDGVASLET
jgi:hypothetical protein